MKRNMVFLWVAAYGLVFALASCFAAHPWVVPLAMAGYAAALIGWVFRTGQARFLGLCAVRKGSPHGFFVPLLMLPVCNLLTVKRFCPTLPDIVLMLSACAVEEIFFRGFLLRYLLKYRALPGILFSSGIFALFHLVNLMGGSADTWMQVLCAFTVGICFGAAAIQKGSLIPCFIAHFLINITAGPIPAGAIPWHLLCIAAYGCFGVHLCRKITCGTT